MKKLETLSLHANGKQSYLVELRKEVCRIKSSSNILEKKNFLKKLKDAEFCNF
ncbi:hypothetical protein [Polaribacter sp. ALD11]|uniref:hypothetical protein n=1 Tax=Polaribacter sp. ALD11 TaxID=2058137 RepID=UPI0012FD68E4|nr:hypothetical protein [Polaribacter sp. ALD11]